MDLPDNDLVTTLLERLGEDPGRDGLVRTPTRFWKSMRFLTSGYESNVHDIVKDALFSEAYDHMVVVKDIEFYSLCEHHLLPFYGRCHIGYIPSGKVLGLSKIPRIVEAFSRRFQIQERLTNQIGEALQEHLKPLGVGVIVDAYHLCMMMRGVQKQNSYTTTSCMLGCFRKLETREEFLTHVESNRLR